MTKVTTRVAEATDNSALVVGQSNNATLATTLDRNAAATNVPALVVQNNNFDAIQGVSSGSLAYGVFGDNAAGYGVVGTSGSGVGMSGGSSSNTGVSGDSGAGTGVAGFSDTGPAVYGSSTSAAANPRQPGVYGISASGAGVIGVASAAQQDAHGVSGQTSATTGGPAGVYGTGPGYGVYGHGTGSGGFGVYGKTDSSAGAGVYGTSPSGNAIWGAAAGSAATAAVRGESTSTSAGSSGVSGTASVGHGVKGTGGSGQYVYGVYGIGGTGTGARGVLGEAGSSTEYAAEFQSVGALHTNPGLLVRGTFVATGAKSAAVPHPDGSQRLLYCQESPEAWFEDFGGGTLAGGRATVTLDPEFALLVHVDNLRVTLTPEGNCNGLYVSSKSPTGFVVQELNGGISNTPFSYRVVAKRKDVAAPRLARIQLPQPTERPAAPAAQDAPAQPRSAPAPAVPPPPVQAPSRDQRRGAPSAEPRR